MDDSRPEVMLALNSEGIVKYANPKAVAMLRNIRCDSGAVFEKEYGAK
jgi:hypothetical protein